MHVRQRTWMMKPRHNFTARWRLVMSLYYQFTRYIVSIWTSYHIFSFNTENFDIRYQPSNVPFGMICQCFRNRKKTITNGQKWYVGKLFNYSDVFDTISWLLFTAFSGLFNKNNVYVSNESLFRKFAEVLSVRFLRHPSLDLANDNLET